MARLIWTNKALDHLEGVVRHIEKDAPITALRFARKIFRCVERLESHPESGSWIEEDDRRIYRQVV